MEFALNERVLTASQTRGCIGSYPWFYDSEEGDEEVLSGEPKKGVSGYGEASISPQMDVVSETEDTRDKGYCFALFKIVWCFVKPEAHKTPSTRI
ncbi:hypothetical protein V1477_019086 [Vespula maculifrons]|uniref:Uncharacterized protein n=1 Tax=Vespula maculifrons TaxID=7453 RepID=A0ABD2ATJ3_VESMC